MVVDGAAPADLHVDRRMAADAINQRVSSLLLTEVMRQNLRADRHALNTLARNVLNTKRQHALQTNALCTVLRRLDGVAPVGLAKGLAIELALYAERGLRPSADIDLFLHPDDLSHFGEVVSAIGGSSDMGESLRWVARAGRVYEHTVQAEGATFDIHTDIANLILPIRQVELFWERLTQIPCPNCHGDHGPWVMDLDLSLVIAVLHFARDRFVDLRRLNDLKQMLDAGPDWDFISEFVQVEGMRDLISMALDVICDLLGRTHPLPSASVANRWLASRVVWPEHLHLRGYDERKRRERTAQAAVSLLLSGRRAEVARAVARRVFPPPDLLDAFGYSERGPYPVRLVRFRVDQTKELRSRLAEDRRRGLQRQSTGGTRAPLR
ncbi:MAG: nucleotidyltransferase family protein [Actinomycetia bacterium]|nr:nucleotidyltransferase family protein [Actinomycetes bacterium]